MTIKLKKYTSNDIEDLSDRDHVRKRTQMYGGNTNPTTYSIPILNNGLKIEEVSFIPAVYKAIGEIFDNAIDEFAHIKGVKNTLIVSANPEEGWYSVSDNGRGIPINRKEDRTGKKVWVPEMVLTRLRSGRNFSNDKERGVIGTNGIGSAFCAFCSTKFEVTIRRDNQVYTQTYTNGTLNIEKPIIQKKKSLITGTKIDFQLDKAVFGDISIPSKLINNKMMELALTNPGISIEFMGTRYKYKSGFGELIKKSFDPKRFFTFVIDTPKVTGEVHIILGAHDEQEERIFTWVNSSLLFDGGKCNTQITNSIVEIVINSLEREAKKQKIVVTKADIRAGLMILGDLKLINPEYDSQSKTRITGPDIKKEVMATFENQWKSCLHKMSSWMDDIIINAIERHHFQTNKKAQDQHKKKLGKRVTGLLDATSKNRRMCSLLITEGDSAKSQICEVRDPKFLGAFALTGKINNVFTSTPAQALKMGKISDMLQAIGLTPGIKASREQLNYGKIVIATDSDHDGGSIFTLLVNCFFKFWPELFDNTRDPIVYRLVAPNIVASKGTKRIHFSTQRDFDKVSKKYKGYTVEYMKGLGSMTKQDWQQVLAAETGLLPITDDGGMANVLTLAFSDDAEARKEWLTLGYEKEISL